jgi:putative ABC transport system permease protein
MKKWLEFLSTAWIGIIAHKLRSFLTMLGIVIGVGAVIALMSIGKGTESRILSSIQGLGTNLVFIQSGSTSVGGVRSAMGSAQTLTLEDAEAIQQDISHIAAIAPYSSTSSQVIAGGNNMNTRITGITPEYQNVLNLTITNGVAMSAEDYRTSNRIAVIGPDVAETLFGDNDPYGQQIRVGQLLFRVIGVIASKGRSFIGDTDSAIMIPLSAMYQLQSRAVTTQGQHIVSSVIIKVEDQKYNNAISEEITSLLRYRHKLSSAADNDFSITTQEDMIKTISEAMSSMTFLLGAIAAISLLVGGIGVMNIMLVSVMERTREIGLRKALGAEELEIIIQFLLEAAILCIAGGIVGILAGWGTSLIVAKTMSYTTVVTADIVILAFSISAAIGLIFGLYPAWRGSRLNPIEALRYE